jgi:hypothetical protein
MKTAFIIFDQMTALDLIGVYDPLTQNSIGKSAPLRKKSPMTKACASLPAQLPCHSANMT